MIALGDADNQHLEEEAKATAEDVFVSLRKLEDTSDESEDVLFSKAW